MQVFCFKNGKEKMLKTTTENQVEIEARSSSHYLKGAELCTEVEKLLWSEAKRNWKGGG